MKKLLLIASVSLLFILSSCASTQTNEEHESSQETFKMQDELFQ